MKIKKRKKLKKRIKRNNLKKRIIYIILFIIINIIGYYIFSYQVSAGEKDSQLIKNYTGHYVYAYFNGQTHGYNVIRYTMNNKTVYCIELGTDITSYTYSSTDNLQSSGLSDEQIQYLKLLSYYGYDYKEHSADIYYYMATQELIWTYLNPNATLDWIESKTEPDKKLNIESQKQDILNLVNNHLTTPNLSTNNTVKVGTKLTLEDTNNVLSNYYIEDNDYVNTKIENNKLIITPKDNIIGNTILKIKENEEYTDNSTLYYYDNSQKMISAGIIEPNNINININIEGATLRILKFDNDNHVNTSSGEASLEKAVYELYDSNKELLKRYETDKYGSYQIEGLPFGIYYIKEIKPSKGYLLNENMITIYLNRTDYTAIVYEQVIKSKIEILKMYGYNNKDYQKPESNITFNIYNNKDKLFKSVTTDDKGYTNFELPYGTYTIKQENTTPGYSKVDDIKITIDENSERIIRYNLLNKDLSTYIKLIKVDSESNLPILNNHATFKVKDLSNNDYISYENNETFETNDKGEIIIPVKLSYGNYEIEEIKPPINYQKDKNIIITIDNNSDFYYNDNYGSIIDIKLLNTINKSTLHIIKDKEIFKKENNSIKYDFEKDKDSSLELYANDDIITPDGIKHYNKDEVIDTIITNNKGEYIINNLYYGKYCLREINSNHNYIENEDTCFELKEDKYTAYIHNYLKKSNINIIKTDAQSGLFLKGAVIELYTEDNILINTSMTNNKGIIKVENIPLGDYYLKEKKAPNNYNLDYTKYYFKLKESDKELTMHITNYKLDEVITPNTGIINKNKYYIIFSIIIILSLVVKIFRNKNGTIFKKN